MRLENTNGAMFGQRTASTGSVENARTFLYLLNSLSSLCFVVVGTGPPRRMLKGMGCDAKLCWLPLTWMYFWAETWLAGGDILERDKEFLLTSLKSFRWKLWMLTPWAKHVDSHLDLSPCFITWNNSGSLKKEGEKDMSKLVAFLTIRSYSGIFSMFQGEN